MTLALVAACVLPCVFAPIAAEASSPNPLSLSPSAADNTQSAQSITATGTGFQSGASVALEKAGQTDIAGTDVSVGSLGTSLSATFDLRTAAPGGWDLKVTNPDNGTGTCANCFTITASAPTTTGASPSSRGQGAVAQDIVITGTNFAHGAVASFSGSGITVNSTTWNSVTQVTADVTIGAAAATGARNVTVSNTDNQSGTCTGCFTVNPGPAPTSMSPSTGTGNVRPTIVGTLFQNAPTVKLTKTGQPDIVGTAVSFTDSTSFQASFNLTDAAPGAWTVVVTNPDGGVGSCACFTVTGVQPTVTGAVPNTVGQKATNKSVEIDGTGFAMGAAVTFTPNTGLTASTTFVSSTVLTVSLTVAAGAPTTARDITVTNTDGQFGTCSGCLTITTGPSVNSVVPATGGQGASSYPLTISGNAFSNSPSVPAVAFSNPNVHGGVVTFTDSSTLTIPVSIDADATTGPVDVTVTNPDSQTDTCFGCFTVTPAPTVTANAPTSLQQGDTNRNVTVTGTGFLSGTALAVSFGDGTHTSNASVVSPTSITVKVTIDSAAVPGPRTVTVTNGDGGVGSCSCFTVLAQPQITSATPALGQGATARDVTISGSNFQSGAGVAFSPASGIQIDGAPVVDTTAQTITVNLTIDPAAATGMRDVTVTNPDGGTGSCSGCFTIDPAPTVGTPSPSAASNTGASGVTIPGTGFVGGATAELDKSGQDAIQDGSPVVSSPTSMTASFDLTDAAPGPWDVRVTNPDGGTGVCAGCFTVGASAPTIQSIDPTEGFQGAGGPMDVTGTNFAHGVQVSFPADSGIDVVETDFTDNQHVTAFVEIAPNTVPGTYDVTVTNTDGQSATCSGCFTVVVPPNNAVTTGGFGANGGSWQLVARNSGSTAPGFFKFGLSSDTPITGDWNGDGVETIGVHRGNTWFLRDTNSTGPADTVFTYGSSTDQVLVGDWDGDGTWTPGVRRGNTWYLRNDNSTGVANVSFSFGSASDTPLVGDWTGGGIFTPAVRRGNVWYFKLDNSTGAADMVLSYGSATDIPFVGDWNGDGIWTPGVYRPSTHQWFLKNSLTGGAADVVFTAPAPGRPVVGDWDGANPS